MTRTLRAADGALRLDGVSVRLGDHEALRGPTLEGEAGESGVVTGPRGAGEPTLREVAAGVRAPARGWRSATGPIAFVPQRATVPPGLPLTARDVVTVGTWRRLGAFRRRDRRARAAVAAAMERTAVSALQRLPFATLSGGQQQRVLLAHGLAGEPTTALDAASVRRIRAVLREEADRGAVVLCVTHDATLIADADREVALRDGMRFSVSR